MFRMVILLAAAFLRYDVTRFALQFAVRLE